MSASPVPWISDGEAGNAAITKRPLKYLLTAVGMDVDNNGYTGLRAGYSPFAYSASGDGTTDDSTALQAMLEHARLLAGTGSAFSLPIVDLQGRTFAVGTQLEVPGGNGMLICNGRLVPGASFTGSQFLISTGRLSDTTLADGFKINNLTFRDLFVDNRHVGGGLQIQRHNRVFVQRCTFVGYQTTGLKTAVGGHEVMISECEFGEYLWGDTSSTGYANAASFVGTGIDLNTPDNHLSDVVIQLSMVGLRVNSQSNLIRGLHCWTGQVAVGSGAGGTLTTFTQGIYQTSNGAFNTYSQCYIDSCEFLIENPWQTTITGCTFLSAAGDPARAFIRLKALAAGTWTMGLVITGNQFKVSGGGTLKGLMLDISGGSFNHGHVEKCLFDANGFSGCTPFYSRVRTSASASGVSQWSFDFTTLIPLGIIQTALMTSYQFGGGSMDVRLTNVGNYTLTVNSYNPATPTTLATTNATIYVDVDVNIPE